MIQIDEYPEEKKISYVSVPGLPDWSLSDRIDVGGFDTCGIFGIVTGVGCEMPGDTIAFGGEVMSESLVGVTFFLRARFFVDGSSSSSGGLDITDNSDGSKSRVFCTSNTVAGIIGSRFCPRPNKVETVD